MDVKRRMERRDEIAAETGWSSRTVLSPPKPLGNSHFGEQAVRCCLGRVREEIAEVIRLVDIVEQGVEAHDLQRDSARRGLPLVLCEGVRAETEINHVRWSQRQRAGPFSA
jgi:hypothetical protein